MKIHFKLSVDSVKEARRELSDFKKNITNKTELFLEKLSEIGIDVINTNVAMATGADDKNVTVETEMYTNGAKTTMIMHIRGEDLLFIEYGAGIYFNRGNQHPWAHEHGYGVGTYPGQKHALDPNGWYYRVGGQLHHSLGTEATMPVYKAYKTMVERAEEIAKEVFNG